MIKTSDETGLGRFLEQALKMIGHEGFHGLKTYDHPRAETVDLETIEFAAKTCRACSFLLELREGLVIKISESGEVEFLI